MHLYDSQVGEFIPRATSGQIADALSRNFLTKLDRHATESEDSFVAQFARRLWGRSRWRRHGGLLDRPGVSAPTALFARRQHAAGIRRRQAQNAVLVELKPWDGCETHYVPDVVSLGVNKGCIRRLRALSSTTWALSGARTCVGASGGAGCPNWAPTAIAASSGA